MNTWSKGSQTFSFLHRCSFTSEQTTKPDSPVLSRARAHAGFPAAGVGCGAGGRGSCDMRGTSRPLQMVSPRGITAWHEGSAVGRTSACLREKLGAGGLGAWGGGAHR